MLIFTVTLRFAFSLDISLCFYFTVAKRVEECLDDTFENRSVASSQGSFDTQSNPDDDTPEGKKCQSFSGRRRILFRLSHWCGNLWTHISAKFKLFFEWFLFLLLLFFIFVQTLELGTEAEEVETNFEQVLEEHIQGASEKRCSNWYLSLIPES